MKVKLIGVVQLGATEFVLVGIDADRIEYKVVAPVRPYYGLTPKPGATWTLIHGRAPLSEGLEAVRDRAMRTHGEGHYIVRYEGSRDSYPYEPLAE